MQIFVRVRHEFKMVHSVAFSARRGHDLCDERSLECFVLGDDRRRKGGNEGGRDGGGVWVRNAANCSSLVCCFYSS